LWAGAADVYAETGEKDLLTALERIWKDAVYRKMYVTGGIAALHKGFSIRGDQVWEAFGMEYELPNGTAYNETCASLAHAMWNWRMLGVTGEARYADVVEQVIYNAALAGWGLDGKSYCYTNPLRRHGKEDRLLSQDSLQRWESTTDPGAPHCYCCPPNMTRTVAEFAGWAYSWSDKTVWVNFYGANSLKTALPDGTRVDLTQATAYPWDGKVTITVKQLSGPEGALMLRIPGWAVSPRLAVNGKPVAVALRPQSYAEVRRRWSPGDKVELDLGMQTRLAEANPRVEEARNQVAVTRGPIVYCLESPDLPAGIGVDDVAVPPDAKFTPRYDAGLLKGVTVLEGEGRLVRSGDWSGQLYRFLKPGAPESVKLRLIPYYAWGNRGIPYMTVWLPLAR
ncbi:MAG: glycoside hydrolase family 127 protein, partial [Acidobacteria bacterium]|nr:glycoside hydrolase family 127 protein [Acidobacteriota bacterium]